MPPKKKRGGQATAVTFPASKMSTRSTKKNQKPNSTGTNPQTPNSKKAKAKRGKTAIDKTKSKANSDDNVVEALETQDQNSPADESLVSSEVDESSTQAADPIVCSNIEENIMETDEIKIPDVDTCEITKQLENLEVEPVKDDIEQESNVEVTPVLEEEPPAAAEEVFEFDNYGEITVEYVTEEFVPVAENTEIVIANDTESAAAAAANEIEHEIVTTETATTDAAENQEITKETPKEIEENVPETEQQEEDSQVVEKKDKSKVKKVAAAKNKRSKEVKKTQNKEKSKGKQIKNSNIDKTEEVRRSSRIKSISVLKQRSRGHGLVKTPKSQETDVAENTALTSFNSDAEKATDSPNCSFTTEAENKPVKVKSRWRRSSELEMNVLTPAAVVMETCGDSEKIAEANATIIEKKLPDNRHDEEVEARLKQFVHLKENLYLTDRMTCKEAKKMTCDCFLTSEETDRGEWGCGEDCLNRLLMIECGNLCPVGERCTNKKFQKSQFAPVEVFKTEKKGLGLRAAANIPYGEFILEYVGEVLDHDEFDVRADDYSNDKNRHYYFMSLRADAIIDATAKGNISRFINHSCDPNAETQKWTVNGELRIGFFSTRTILAGEEITFDYRFQRYGKEAQKCYCEASTCRGWLGEEPEDEYEDEEEEDEDEETECEEQVKKETEGETEIVIPSEKIDSEIVEDSKPIEEVQKTVKKEKKKRIARKKPRKDKFEDLDQLDEEIDMLVATGLKNQTHTLKLSRLMVRAKEPAQRTKLLRVLRRGELPCRRLFLDYHGLRLIHGYMTDAQHLAKTDKKYESLRLEMLQTLATLPIPNKTMLQDSKVLPTVETWSCVKGDDLPIDSDSCSPKTDQEEIQNSTENVKEVDEEIRKSVGMDYQGSPEKVANFSNTHGKELADEISSIFQEEMDTTPNSTEAKDTKPEIEVKTDEPNYEEEITALALKLLEEWSNLKEVFKIPKKERIEQMKEHEREANRGYIAAGLGLDQDAEKKNESRYRILKRYRSLDKVEINSGRKCLKLEDRTFSNFPKLGKYERRKMFALQVEQREEERRRKQREMWRQHEQHCILLGTDPRLTAPYDPNRGYQCIWNPQIGQWQNYPIQNTNLIFNTQNPAIPAMNLQTPNPGYPYMHTQQILPANVNQLHPLPSLPYQEEIKKEEDYGQVKFMGPIPPPVKLPPKWKCAKDKYGRPYYYHIKIRKSQWEPPAMPQPAEEQDDSSETTSSSDTSSLSSDTSSEESDSDDDVDDTKLLLQVKKQMEKQAQAKIAASKSLPVHLMSEEAETPSPAEEEKYEMSTAKEEIEEEVDKASTSVDTKINDVLKDEKSPSMNKRKRAGLVHEIIISPRSEEDRIQFREDLKRYKMNKEKLKREKELILQQSKKHTKEKRNKTIIKLKMKEMNDSNSEHAKKIKESFRSSMATVVVTVLNAYRKPDCKEGRITNTEDFKHLARKLTHFVMLKEMKHIEKIEDLVCTENVKTKAREYIRKYMSKFGENYQKRSDEPDY